MVFYRPGHDSNRYPSSLVMRCELFKFEFLVRTPQLYVAIANPLFAAPGCTKQEETSVRVNGFGYADECCVCVCLSRKRLSIMPDCLMLVV